MGKYKIRNWCVKKFYILWMKARIWKCWYKIYRFFHFRKYKKYESDLIKTTYAKHCQRLLDLISYYPDTWKQLGDSLGSVGYVSYILKTVYDKKEQPDKYPFDCGYYAILASHSLKNSENYTENKLLFIYYRKINGKCAGHAVCILKDKFTNKWCHLGNWGYYDNFASLKDVILDLTKDRTFLGYALIDPSTLKLLKVSSKL